MKFNSFFGGCLTTLIVVAGAALIYHGCQKTSDSITTEETIDVTRDTIPVFIDTPILKDSTVLRYVTVPVPVQDKIWTHVADTLKTDSVNVVLPITQKMYQDSTYQAWVSGYMPALDSIRVFQPVTTITRTITNTQIKYKTKRWGLGVQAGVGFTSTKVEPYIGIGVTYNIFSW